MTASLGRGIALILVGLALLLLALWSTVPLWSPSAARALLADADVEVLALEAGHPGPDGMDIATLAVRTAGAEVRAETLRLSWSPTAGLEAVMIDRVALDWRPAPATTATDASATPPLPGQLLAALPFERLSLRSLSATAELADGSSVGAEGQVDLDATGLRYDGTTTLPDGARRPLRVEITGDDRLELVLGAVAEPLVTARARLEARGEAIAVTGSIDVAADAVPSLVPAAPEVTATLEIDGVVDGDRIDLRALPGTRVAVDVPASTPERPALAVVWAPTEPRRLRLEGPRIADLDPITVAFEAALDETRATGTVTVHALAGTAEALDFDLETTVALTGAGPEGRLDTMTSGSLYDLARLRLDGGPLLNAARLEDAAAGWVVENIGIELPDDLTLEVTDPVLDAARLTVRLGALSFGGRRLDLADLDLSVALRGTPAAPGARLEAQAPGLELDATAGLDTAGVVVNLEQARLDLGPDGLPARTLAFLTDLPLALSGGSLSVGPARWPPRIGDRAAVELSGIDLAFEDIEVEGGGAELAAIVLPDGVALSLGQGRATRLTQADANAVDLRVAMTGRLPTTDLARQVPERLELEALDADLARIEAGSVVVEAITAHAAGVVTTGPGTELALTLDAARLDVGVPAADLRCGVGLSGQDLSITGCRLDVLGGRVEAPAGRVDLTTVTGYVPVAVEGVDLGAVLVLMQDDALQGDGVLDGALPVRIVDGVPTVQDGYVGARPPGGRLRYAADTALLERLSQPGLSLAMTALGDFRYGELGSFVDYETDGTLALRIRLAGASPDVEGGRPINFNLNVTQNLPLLLQSLRLSQNIGETLERRLRERNLVP